MNTDNILYVVHCIDTEGPLDETLDATFARLESLFGISMPATKENLKRIQNMEIDFQGREESIANCFRPELLNYNSNWTEIDVMLKEILTGEFRLQLPDSYGNGWIYSWHCMDHIGLTDNPRNKDYGYGKIFQYYKSKLEESRSSSDEINWHFHPLSISRNPTHAATSYVNSYDVLIEIICKRILQDKWFPVVNRPGFHSERPDSHLFLEQWIPFDYANQFCEESQNQPDTTNGRFGDWRRAPSTWRGYNPSHDDYQIPGNCRRTIFRCLNVGTRMRLLTEKEVAEAFLEARVQGNAILAFANHDWRDMKPDINYVTEMLRRVSKKFPDVKIRYSGAEDAAVMLKGFDQKEAVRLEVNLVGNTLIVECTQGEIFGSQPFLAIQAKEGQYIHDNLDVIEPRKKWGYVLDEQTILLANISQIGVGTAGLYGKYSVASIRLSDETIYS